MSDPVGDAVDAIRERVDIRPDVLITLGSGLGSIADAIEDAADVEVARIPGLPSSTVPGHRGLLRFGRIGTTPVVAQVGRAHLYEGHDAAEVVRTVEVAAELGCTTFVVTNAAGGLRTEMRPGDVVAIRDHLNLTGVSPLTGRSFSGRPPFVALETAYDAELRILARHVASSRGLEVRECVYAGVAGPQYETPAEVAMLRTLGADIVGMSTVLEVIAARRCGLRVLGLSTITNVHGTGETTDHDDVLAVADRAGLDVARIVGGVLAGR